MKWEEQKKLRMTDMLISGTIPNNTKGSEPGLCLRGIRKLAMLNKAVQKWGKNDPFHMWNRL